MLLIDCLLIALDAHMFTINGYGPGTKAQGQKLLGPQYIVFATLLENSHHPGTGVTDGGQTSLHVVSYFS